MTKETFKNGVVGRTWRLKDILGLRVVAKGRRIGKLEDLVFAEAGPIPHVTHILVHRSFGNPRLVVPVDRIVELGGRYLELAVDEIAPYEAPHLDEAMLLS